MNGDEFDLFTFFRTTLFVFLTIYAALTLLSASRRTIHLLGGADPRKDLLRLYVSYHLVTIRLAPLRAELIQISLWLVLLLLISRFHALIA